MKRTVRRLFDQETDIIQGLLGRLGLRRGRRLPALRRPRSKGLRRPAREVTRARAPAYRRILGHRVAILSFAGSIAAHAILLSLLGRVKTEWDAAEALDLKDLQISVLLPRPPAPKAPEPPPAEEIPVPPPPSPEPPSEPALVAEEIPDAPPGPVVEGEDVEDSEGGFPGTGDIARDEPEGSPGPPAVLGVGASPPPGDGHGLGGEGEGDGFGSRTRGKARAIRRYGGSGATEDAVSRGLAWLAAHQDLDGGWSASQFNLHCQHFTQCIGKGLSEFDAGVTALSLLAFLGAGQGPGPSGTYGRVVERALGKLVSGQRRNGCIGENGERYMYNHAIGAFALCEAVSMSRDAALVGPAARAVNFIVEAQQADGGWDYTEAKTGRNDLSITGWQVMALRAARTAGIPVPEATLERARRFLVSAVLSDGQAVYANKGIGAGRKGVNMTAVALLSGLYLGASLDDPWVLTAADRLIRNPPDPELVPDWDGHHQSSYYWYTATLALFNMDGARWDAWNHFIQKEIIPLQSRASHEEGSWAPDGNWIGALGGRVSTTALNVLTLEVYYRYPPLHAYGKDGKE